MEEQHGEVEIQSEGEEVREASASAQIVDRTGRATSVVWQWFGYLENDRLQVKPICKVCHRSVSSKTGNTTNLFNHLKRYHPAQHKECMQKQGDLGSSSDASAASTSSSTAPPKQSQRSITEAFTVITPYDKHSKRAKTITNTVAYCIAKDMMPINTVEKVGFRKLMHVLDSRYQLPGRKYFSQTALPQLYETCRAEVEKELQNVRYFAATTDIWSSRTSQPYLSLTVHYVDENWILQSKCLQALYFPEDHTGDLIGQGLEDALASWGLKEERMVCITTDNAANMVKATTDKGWSRMQCFGHRLHLAVEGSMKDKRVERATGVCKKVVGAFSFSWKRKRELLQAQQELNLPKHMLMTESPTRWGSRMAMVARVLEQEKAITKVLSADRKTRHLTLSWQDIEVLEAVHKALNPLVEFTDTLSGEQYVSVSYIKPVLHLFNEEVLKIEEDDLDLTRHIKGTVTKYLNEKYSDNSTDDLLNLASLVDPRFRLKYIQDAKVEAVKTTAVEQMVTDPPKSPTSTRKNSRETSASTPAKVTKKTLGSFFKKSGPQAPASGLTEAQAAEAELNSFLMAPDVDSEADPLQWWKLHSQTYPRVSRLAKRYLCIPATSSPSERAFSASGNIVTCHRAALKPDAVDRLLFLAKNL